MGQEDMLRVLKENGGWMPTKEISERSGISYVNTQMALCRLFRSGEVERKGKMGNKGFQWRTKEKAGKL